MKAVLIVTVYRRYFELAANLRRVHELTSELSEKPDVVVVWAQPEVGRLWFFQKLLAEGLITKLLTRPTLPGESHDRPTTYPESHNIRKGLDWVRENYPKDSTYAIVMAADVWLKEGEAFKFIDEHMTNDNGQATVFFWPNGCVQNEIWHTNCFAVSLDERYWPPVIGSDCEDTLELAYGKKLCGPNLPGVLRSHNSRERRFVHCHQSEKEPEWPIRWQEFGQGTPLLTVGYIPWWKRVLQFFQLAKPFKRPVD